MYQQISQDPYFILMIKTTRLDIHAIKYKCTKFGMISLSLKWVWKICYHKLLILQSFDAKSNNNELVRNLIFISCTEVNHNEWFQSQHNWWITNYLTTLHGCLGSVLDLAVTHDDRTTTDNLFVGDSSSGRIRHTLTGHTNKVCAVDTSRASNHNIVSAAYYHTIKVWDLNRGFCINTIVKASNCNAVSYGIDGISICSGHVDGNLRLWDSRSGKLINDVSAHSQAVTSVSVSTSGNLVLTSYKW